MFVGIRGFFVSVCVLGLGTVCTSSVAQAMEFKVSCNQQHKTPYEKMDAKDKVGFVSLGRLYFKRCAMCHKLSPQDSYSRNPMKGPSLFGIVDKQSGSDKAYRYRVFKSPGFVWSSENIQSWIQDPAAFIARQGAGPMSGVMTLHKIGCEEGRAAVARYLQENARGPHVSLKTARSLVEERVAYLKNNDSNFTGGRAAKASLLLTEAHSEYRSGYPDNALVLVDEALQSKGLNSEQHSAARELKAKIVKAQ